MAKKRLTEYLAEVLTKSQTEEGRRELLEERDRLEAEAKRMAMEAYQRPPAAAEDAQEGPEGTEGAHTPPEGTQEPLRVRAVTRVDPIMPVVQSVREHPARAAARLAFGGLVNGRDNLDDAQLPLFEPGDGPRVPILELADIRGGPVMARGRGAPLDLRLFVAACVLTPYVARGGERPLAVTVRELRDFLFPNGWQRWRDWPRIRKALYRVHNYAIPGPFLWMDGRIVRDWLPVALKGGASADADLDDLVVLQVMLPPGTGSGAIIDRRELTRLGVESAPRYRAYIAAHSVAWRPGVTRRRHPRNRRVHLWSSDPGNYPILTAADRDRLAFGAAATTIRHRSRDVKDAAWEDLPGVEILTRQASTPDGCQGWLVVPDEAAAAIRNRRAAEASDMEDFDD